MCQHWGCILIFLSWRGLINMLSYLGREPCIRQHLKTMSPVIKNAFVDIVFSWLSAVPVTQYSDTLDVMRQKILQPHFLRISTSPGFECMSSKADNCNNTVSSTIYFIGWMRLGVVELTRRVYHFLVY
jgi:hypothetical protein